MGITVIAAVVTLLSYLIADILYVVVDPRITYE
jgi:ABC-type dipeptide/oligopeptide/nickel transport system permease component